MNRLKLLVRSLAYYRRFHLWTVLGAMLGTAVLTGALVTGDSVGRSLRGIVFDRLGGAESAMMSGDRFIDASAADTLARAAGAPVAPLLLSRGMAVSGGGERRVNDVQVTGYNEHFRSLGGGAVFGSRIPEGSVIINTELADRLDLDAGDMFLLRLHDLDFIPQDISWTPESGAAFAERVAVAAVVSPDELGGFNLRAEQVAPLTVFVPLGELSRKMGMEGAANVLLAGSHPGSPMTAGDVQAAFRASWSITDAGYILSPLETGGIELSSERIFLDTPVVNAAERLFPDAKPVFSYFVNDIRLDGRSTPYSFVAASSDHGLSGDEIIINDWLAEDLGARPGDLVSLTYYVLGPTRALREDTAEFTVKDIVPVRGAWGDRSLAPRLPGIADAENCRDWDPGIPIDLDRIRDRDEDYWDEYRETPKAFISLDRARSIWKNRYGDLTAIRFDDGSAESIGAALSSAVDPASLGYVFRDVRASGLRASADAVAFDQLFLGLSFFVIAASLLLTGMLFGFSLEQRSEEIGLFMALGFGKRFTVRRMLLEGMIIAAAGSAAGVLSGIAYTGLIMAALKSVWRDIVGTSALEIHVSPSTLATAFAAGAAIHFIVILMVTRNRLRRSATELQSGGAVMEEVGAGRQRAFLGAGVACTALAVILVLSAAGKDGGYPVAPFFAAGALLLAGGMAFAGHLLGRFGRGAAGRVPGIVRTGLRTTARRRTRSLTVIGLLAMGVFTVFTVGANRRVSLDGADQRSSGTGGFALFCETSIPVLHDLNSEQGRNVHSLGDIDPERFRFVPFRVREGDEASCLNLNRVSEPRLLGVETEELSGRGAFSFAAVMDGADTADPWSLLAGDSPDDVVNGIADQTVITWSLGMTVGDSLRYTDEYGRPFYVRLAAGLENSVFQGNVIISNAAFTRRFPSNAGARVFLVDAPFAEAEETAERIEWALGDLGAEVEKTTDRLARFNRVENTYLSIFLILGTFGLLIGTIGIGIVIARTVAERRGELALLRAVGYSPKMIHSLLIAEHAFLVFAGIGIGMASALLAAVPALLGPGSKAPFLTTGIMLAILVLNGGLWTWAATALVVRKDLLPALRNE